MLCTLSISFLALCRLPQHAREGVAGVSTGCGVWGGVLLPLDKINVNDSAQEKF